jgi:hypothetical protein
MPKPIFLSSASFHQSSFPPSPLPRGIKNALSGLILRIILRHAAFYERVRARKSDLKKKKKRKEKKRKKKEREKRKKRKVACSPADWCVLLFAS